MGLTNFLKPNMIWIKTDCVEQAELFKLVAERGKELGYVTSEFLSSIHQREETFPTGLELDGYGVAIPHTDPEHVKEQFISVITTENGIPFYLMDDAQRKVSANVIFILGLNKPHNQLQVLQQLIGMIQKKEVVHSLLEAKDATEIKKILEER